MRAETQTVPLGSIDKLAPVLAAVQSVGDQVDGVFLVGGTVRDILLGKPSFDVDIAVEGDGIAFAEALAAELQGETRAHERFGTSTVLYGEGEHVDIVTCRAEVYAAPGALPAVEAASIREDLHRRDFTINAMAVSLEGTGLGRLVDPFGGRADLDVKAIRVLHDRSFSDDPTRIFRAIRYENRLGFAMDPRTELLARACLETGLIADLSPARLRDEVVALLSEGELRHSILRLAELGAAAAIHPCLAADGAAVELIERVTALRDRHALGVPDWRLALAVLARRLPPAEIHGWASRLQLRRRDTEAIADAVTFAPTLVERFSGAAMLPAEVVELADPYAPDTPLFALALADLPPLRDYFERLGGVRLEIGGGDLAELGLGESPRVGEILSELRRRKLNGELGDRESELAAARDLIAAN